MKKCLVDDNALRFSRTIYGLLALVSFLFRLPWLVLAIALLMIIGIISNKTNLFYQFFVKVIRKVLKKTPLETEREVGELRFACGLGASFLIFAYLLFSFTPYGSIGWIFVAIMSFLMLVAGIAGLCTASLLYALLKNVFKQK